MDWLTFIATLIGALAWPLTILVVLALLRRPLAELIPFLARLRYKDFELDFSRRLEEAAAEAAALPTPQLGDALPPTPDDRLLRLAEASPRAAILEAWISLEGAAVAALRRREVAAPSAQLRSPLQLVQLLEQAEIIDARQAAVFHDLRGLRNSAAHAAGFEPSTAAAIEYVQLAARLERLLREA